MQLYVYCENLVFRADVTDVSNGSSDYPGGENEQGWLSPAAKQYETGVYVVLVPVGVFSNTSYMIGYPSRFCRGPRFCLSTPAETGFVFAPG